MTALETLRVKAAEKYPSYPLELEHGLTVELKSIMVLDDDELKLFSASQKRLSELDENEDLDELKAQFVDILAGVSTDKAATAAHLELESMGVLSVLFEEYAGSLKTGAKSLSTE